MLILIFCFFNFLFAENISVTKIDSNKDGKPELIKIFQIGENDKKFLIRKELDINADGKIDYIYNYGKESKLSSIEIDHDFDGNIDEKRFLNEKTGVLLRKEIDINFDKKPDIITIYENNLPIAKTIDKDADGKIDTWEEYESGELSKILFDTNNDGIPDKEAGVKKQKVYKPNFDKLSKKKNKKIKKSKRKRKYKRKKRSRSKKSESRYNR